jgi:hypothetical protein
VLDEDDYIEDAMAEYGYVALVATEKQELVAVPDGAGLAEGSAVKVKCEGHRIKGEVVAINGKLYVSMDTVRRTVARRRLFTIPMAKAF